MRCSAAVLLQCCDHVAELLQCASSMHLLVSHRFFESTKRTLYARKETHTHREECVAVLLQSVAVCYSVLQCIAVCCSVLQCVATYTKRPTHTGKNPIHNQNSPIHIQKSPVQPYTHSKEPCTQICKRPIKFFCTIDACRALRTLSIPPLRYTNDLSLFPPSLLSTQMIVTQYLCANYSHTCMEYLCTNDLLTCMHILYVFQSIVVLQCIVECCSVVSMIFAGIPTVEVPSHCVAACCSVWQCVAVRCSVWQYTFAQFLCKHLQGCRVWRSMVQCVASGAMCRKWCNMQHVASCCSVNQ